MTGILKIDVTNPALPKTKETAKHDNSIIKQIIYRLNDFVINKSILDLFIAQIAPKTNEKLDSYHQLPDFIRNANTTQYDETNIINLDNPCETVFFLNAIQ